VSGLLERLAEGPVICAEGYLFELERRGYVQAGAYVPEVVLDDPDAVVGLHREFVRAGSDVVEAFTYYGHREKLRTIGKEHLLEPLNRQALAIASQVAQETGTLLAGDLSNTNIYHADDAASQRQARAMFEEQVGWAADAGVDFVIAETFPFAGEPLLALEAIKAGGLAAVITLAVPKEGLFDGVDVVDACKQLEQAGADVVGLNCFRGPSTMLPLVKEIRAAVSCHVAALPVTYRTTADEPTFISLSDTAYPSPPTGKTFPTALEPFLCNRYELADFAREAYAANIRYLGLCCGGSPHYVRAMAEALGRTPPASRYSPDMSKHAVLGDDEKLDPRYSSFAEKL
jgi:betaine-homocysteine S-methyltransferase